jgi:hypothetical protein
LFRTEVERTVPNIGKNLRLFLVDGSPTGLITAEIMNWTGHVLVGPRAKVVELLQRPEASRTGVYLLTGTSSDTGETLVYVGEGDNVSVRVASHARDKDFWESACLVTSKDQNITKAHARYLESKLISLVAQTGAARLLNATAPEALYLPEAEVSDMDQFVEHLQVLLPVLGLTFVRDTPRPSAAAEYLNHVDPGIDVQSRTAALKIRPTVGGEASPTFKMNGQKAKAVEIDGQMIVLAGSEARASEQASLANNVRLHRKRLLENGALVQAGSETFRFTEDVAFSSPSAAAQAIMGTSRNGRTDWVLETTGETYGDWQVAAIRSSMAKTTEVE